MKRKLSSKLIFGLLAVGILIISIITVAYAASSVDGCHTYCAKKYPTSFSHYSACMDGCLHAPQQ